jgi:hypothetical protein
MIPETFFQPGLARKHCFGSVDGKARKLEWEGDLGIDHQARY